MADLWRLLAPFHRTFGWFVGLLIVYEGLQIVEGYTISLVVRLFGAGAETLVWVLLLAGLIVYDEIFMRLDNRVDWHVMTRHSNPVYKYLKASAIAKFLEMDIPWHLRRNSGALVGKVADGVWRVMTLVDSLSWEFVPTLVQTSLSLIPIMVISPQTALVSVVAFALFSWLTVKGHQEKKPFRRERHDLYEHEWHRGIEIVQSAETNLMFGQAGRLLAEQEDLHGRIVELGEKEAWISVYKYNRWRVRVLTLARRSVLVIWVWQLHTGAMDIAGLIFVNILTEKLFHSFWRFARLLDRASEASEGISRLAELMETKRPGKDGWFAPKIQGPVGIELERVCFSYEGEYDEQKGALHDFSLNVEPGSIVAIVGPSGAGKTTIRRVITRLFPIQSGRVTLAGVDIREWKHEELLKLFSYVPQGDDVFIFSGTIKENIAFPKHEATDGEVEDAAILAGIHEFIVSLPNGYDTLVGERGKRLSGGQKQRVALARAILADRSILILDEATNAVDAITEQEIQIKMRTILAGKTAIIIAHRLSTIWDIADKIVVIDQGRKVEEGTHAELVRLGGLYAKMVALQTAESL